MAIYLSLNFLWMLFNSYPLSHCDQVQSVDWFAPALVVGQRPVRVPEEGVAVQEEEEEALSTSKS